MIYALSFQLGDQVTLRDGTHVHSREDLLARFNDHCADLVDSDGETAFFGVTEGVLLAEEAHERGYETESWVLDAGEAPHERDWLAREKNLNLTAYFKTEKTALNAKHWLLAEYQLLSDPILKAEEEQDWNATWKASFTGIEVHEGLRVLPPWHEEWQKVAGSNDPGAIFQKTGIIAINPGAGFGTGTHETTQLCLKILSSVAENGGLRGKTVLDFGSGSGILGIAAALHGAKVYCVEIDPMANENAFENARMNGVADRIQISREIPAEIRGGKVDVLIANILRPILLQFADEIKDCLKSKAELVLSGLIETDLPPVIAEYQKGGSPFHVERLEKNEWRALWLRRN
jgi:ribosomal protein L11 methyltransferase